MFKCFRKKNAKGKDKQSPSQVNHRPQAAPSHRPDRAIAQYHLHSNIHSPQTNTGGNHKASGTQHGRSKKAVPAFKPYKIERINGEENWLPPSVEECRHMLANTSASDSETEEDYPQGKTLVTVFPPSKGYRPSLSRSSSSSRWQFEMNITDGPKRGIASNPNDSAVCVRSSHATYDAKAPPSPPRNYFQRKPIPSTQPRSATFRAPRLPTKSNVPGLPNRLRDPRCLICHMKIYRNQEICETCEDNRIAQYSVRHRSLVPQPLQTSMIKSKTNPGHQGRIAGSPATSVAASVRKPLLPPKIELPQFSSNTFGREVFEAAGMRYRSGLPGDMYEDDWAEYYFDGQRDAKRRS